MTGQLGNTLKTHRLWLLGIAVVAIVLGVMIVKYSLDATPPPNTLAAEGISSTTAMPVSDPPVVAASRRELHLRIDGMYCPGCIGSVRRKLSRLEGVSDVRVWVTGASITYDSTRISPQQIQEAATFFIYKASVERDRPIQ